MIFLIYKQFIIQIKNFLNFKLKNYKKFRLRNFLTLLNLDFKITKINNDLI